MDLSEFSQKFGAQSAPTYQYRGEPFNLKFSRYENGNWQVNLITPTSDEMTEPVVANEITVALKSKLADDFIALAANKQEYLKFLLNNNIIVKHPFFSEKVGQPGENRPLINEAYQFTPDFIAYVQHQSGYDMTTERDISVIFELDRPTSGFTRLIFERDAQLRENPDLGKNDSSENRHANTNEKQIGSKEDQVAAASVLETLTYIANGEEVPVVLHVKRYAIDGNWYVDLRERDTQSTICIITDHGPKLSSRYQLHLNLATSNGFGDQINVAWLKATELFSNIDVANNKGELNTVGLLVLTGQL